jgi:hypothetical protein
MADGTPPRWRGRGVELALHFVRAAGAGLATAAERAVRLTRPADTRSHQVERATEREGTAARPRGPGEEP